MKKSTGDIHQHQRPKNKCLGGYMSNILVVDDEKSIRITLKAFLEADNYTVSIAEDVDEALKMLKKKAFDVVVTDIILPRITGVDLLKSIKRISPDVQVIMMTGEPNVETATESLRVGAFDYLYKPITKNDVLKTVKNAVMIKQLNDENRQHKEELELMIQDRTAELIEKHEQLIKEIEERKQSENRLQAITLTMADWIWEVDKNGRYTYVSDSVKNILGYSSEELIGKTLFELMPEEERDKVSEVFLKFVSKSRPIIDLENWNLSKDGTKVCLLTNGVPIIDDDNELQGYRGVNKDITSQKKLTAEKSTIEARLKQAQKMESIGTLAGGIAHDFNNILTSIIGFSDMALEAAAKGSVLEDDLNEIYTAGLRAKDLVRQILTFARQADEKNSPIRIDSIANEVIKFIRSSIPTSIEIKSNINSKATILGNQTQVHQIFMNLFTNAAYAMGDDNGILEVCLEDVQFDNKVVGKHSNLKFGAYIKITVSDTGTGIPQEVIDSIFEPYFTTKDQGEGTGLGLAVVHGIVEAYGGAITVSTRKRKGTVFTIHLPIVKKLKNNELHESKNFPKGTEKILLIDDELSIVKLNKKILESLGYHVTTQTSSIDALALFKSKPKNFDLVITDMGMPKLTGNKLAQAMTEIRPDIPILLCTGYSKNLSANPEIDYKIKAVLKKPIDRSDFAKTIRKIMGNKSGDR
jgi:PAS domain S-box-containing protein